MILSLWGQIASKCLFNPRHRNITILLQPQNAGITSDVVAEYGLSRDFATSAWRSGKIGRLRCGVRDLERRKHSSSLILVHSSCSLGQIIYFMYRFGKLI